MGFIHRDIKPGNFVLGLPNTRYENRVYMVDFGIARKIVGSGGSIHTPRKRVCDLLFFVAFLKNEDFH